MFRIKNKGRTYDLLNKMALLPYTEPEWKCYSSAIVPVVREYIYDTSIKRRGYAATW